FNCPGWSQSGGPWVKPEQAMRRLATSEIRVTGPKKFSDKLAAPETQFQDISVLAFPASSNDADTLSAHSPRVSSTPAAANAGHLADGKLDTAVELPLSQSGKESSATVDFELDSPLTARTLEVIPSNQPFGAEAELLAKDKSGQFQTVRKFKCDRSNMATNVGFMPRGPVTISFPETTSQHFRVVFKNFFGNSKRVELAEINLTGAARLESYIEKQLAKMHPTPLPTWDTYLWPTQSEPESGSSTVSVER
ncbi:MAG: glycoside hydrolase family 2, partial [Akkermansiaceae bacterium]|nr:glycoside hydrolase family 2 [Akkermansiaceae bacterium]